MKIRSQITLGSGQTICHMIEDIVCSLFAEQPGRYEEWSR